jgi:hypothetical protein
MKRKFTFLFSLILVFGLIVGFISTIGDDPKTDETPFKTGTQTMYPDTITPPGFPLPVVFSFRYSAITGMNGGNVGAMYINGKYYFNMWNSTSLYRYWDNGTGGGPGTQADLLTYQGSCRDMTWDGQYLYGGAASTTLYRFDTLGVTKGSFVLTGNIRALTWDPNRKGFWHCDWADDITCRDTANTLKGTITGTTMASKYGLGFDSVSAPDSAFLWVWGQDFSVTTDTTNKLYKVHIGSNTIKATYTIDVQGSLQGIAGGAEVCKIGNAYVLLLNYQNTHLIGYKLKDAGPTIAHTPLPNTQNLAGPYPVNCVITPSGSGIMSGATKLFWSRNSTTTFDSLVMTTTGGNNWTQNIPGNGSAATYRYFIMTKDSLGRVANAGSLASPYLFQAIGTDTVKPVITHTPNANCPRLLWPSALTCQATHWYGVDSVWVKWYKNVPANAYRFNLAKGTGTTWSGNFNSDTSQVAINDSIFYRIFARSSSTQHTMDSTALNQFKIVNQVTVTIGTGTTAVSHPFYTFYDDSRTDMLYLASEIGVPTGGYITQIAYNVVAAYPLVMNGFNLKMQNSTLTTLTGFADTTAWTVVKSGTYSVPGTGWQTIPLTTPFYLQSGKNLIIEICFNNSTYTSSSTVNATAATPLRVWHRHNDLATTDGCVVPMSLTSTTELPNIQIVINPGPVGIGNNGNSIPNVYTLNQNYPNPFNPVTKINYSVAKQGLVSMKVYDILGREVTTLVNEVKSPGYYIVDFDGSNLSSGVYFYRLNINGFTDVKRMMLIK